MLQHWRPARPVYCIYPHLCRRAAREFLDGFEGTVLYAVKANDHPQVIRQLHAGGIRHFDCASIAEIERVHACVDDPTCYLMVPVWPRGTVRDARERFGTRHFLVDHLQGLATLASEVELDGLVVFARMAAHHPSAVMDLSSKFGAAPEEMPRLLTAIAKTGAEPAVAFNVGSTVVSTEAYVEALESAFAVLGSLPFEVRLMDIGGGFPLAYPDYPVPPLGEYFRAIRQAKEALDPAGSIELLAEPGRALAAPGLSAVVEVLLNKGDRIYINDGMYGIFWELRFKAHRQFPVRSFRNGEPVDGATRPYRVFGPTCDSFDVFPDPVELPAELRPGDHLEFGQIGAYSLSGRTDFNGHYSDQVVSICDEAACPPVVPSRVPSRAARPG